MQNTSENQTKQCRNFQRFHQIHAGPIRFPPKSIHTHQNLNNTYAKSIRTSTKTYQNLNKTMENPIKIHQESIKIPTIPMQNPSELQQKTIRISTKPVQNPSELQQNSSESQKNNNYITPSPSQETQSRPPSGCAEQLPDSGCWCCFQWHHRAIQQQFASTQTNRPTSTEELGHQHPDRPDRIPASAIPGIHVVLKNTENNPIIIQELPTRNQCIQATPIWSCSSEQHRYIQQRSEHTLCHNSHFDTGSADSRQILSELCSGRLGCTFQTQQRQQTQ